MSLDVFVRTIVYVIACLCRITTPRRLCLV